MEVYCAVPPPTTTWRVCARYHQVCCSVLVFIPPCLLWFLFHIVTQFLSFSLNIRYIMDTLLSFKGNVQTHTTNRLLWNYTIFTICSNYFIYKYLHSLFRSVSLNDSLENIFINTFTLLFGKQQWGSFCFGSSYLVFLANIACSCGLWFLFCRRPEVRGVPSCESIWV